MNLAQAEVLHKSRKRASVWQTAFFHMEASL
jgi:hypothetical protein